MGRARTVLEMGADFVPTDEKVEADRLRYNAGLLKRVINRAESDFAFAVGLARALMPIVKGNPHLRDEFKQAMKAGKPGNPGTTYAQHVHLLHEYRYLRNDLKKSRTAAIDTLADLRGLSTDRIAKRLTEARQVVDPKDLA